MLYDDTYHLTEVAHAVISEELYKKINPIVLAWANSSNVGKLSLTAQH